MMVTPWRSRRSPRILPTAKRAHGVAEAIGRDAQSARHGDAGQHINDAVTAGRGDFEIHAEAAEAGAGGQQFDLLGAHLGVGGKAEQDAAARVDLREIANVWVVGIEHGDAGGRELFDQFAFGARHAVDAVRSFRCAPSLRW